MVPVRCMLGYSRSRWAARSLPTSLRSGGGGWDCRSADWMDVSCLSPVPRRCYWQRCSREYLKVALVASSTRPSMFGGHNLKFIIAGGVIVLAVAYLVMMGLQGSTEYFL